MCKHLMAGIALADLKKDIGMETLMAFMERKPGKDDMEDSLENYSHFKERYQIT